jgi:TonB family protein
VAVAPTRASGAPDSGGEHTIIVDDGMGTFVIRKAPPGAGPLAGGSNQKPGELSSDRADRGAARAQAAAGPKLRLSWSQFEDAIGANELLAQREAYVAQRKSQSQGQSRQRSWKKFRAAIENFVPNVSPGNQTALNTAASPFAAYLAEVHRRIHREFAYEFLANLPIAGGPYGDRDLYTVLEIVINGDGTVHEVGIVKTSGFSPFDYGAFNAVMEASPYSAPPRQILSGDGRVYVRWGFYRNERQCGTFNAEPYILPNPKGTPAPGQGPLRDQGNDQRAPAVVDPTDGELGRSAPLFAIPPAMPAAKHG